MYCRAPPWRKFTADRHAIFKCWELPLPTNTNFSYPNQHVHKPIMPGFLGYHGSLCSAMHLFYNKTNQLTPYLLIMVCKLHNTVCKTEVEHTPPLRKHLSQPFGHAIKHSCEHGLRHTPHHLHHRRPEVLECCATTIVESILDRGPYMTQIRVVGWPTAEHTRWRMHAWCSTLGPPQ